MKEPTVPGAEFPACRTLGTGEEAYRLDIGVVLPTASKKLYVCRIVLNLGGRDAKFAKIFDAVLLKVCFLRYRLCRSLETV
jgi:hypothetical protein